jgi:hypothetical protein
MSRYQLRSSEGSHPRWFGKRVAKYFETRVYYGTIVEYQEPYWRVRYDDGDEEDFTEKEIKEHAKLLEKLTSSEVDDDEAKDHVVVVLVCASTRIEFDPKFTVDL